MYDYLDELKQAEEPVRQAVDKTEEVLGELNAGSLDPQGAKGNPGSHRFGNAGSGEGEHALSRRKVERCETFWRASDR